MRLMYGTCLPSLFVGESEADSPSKWEQKSIDVTVIVYRHAQVQPGQNISNLWVLMLLSYMDTDSKIKGKSK